ncbi:MAG: phosphate transport system substrate-binding protein [Actinomycetota bacterium]|jgi:ABC-type phosphate transport system substrate-binding protein|nr:phosphate transport system substrate-binding protein [Actinomycetota bacterium]
MRIPLPKRRLLVALACCLALVAAVPAGAANSHAQISGSGSSWAYNAVNQWIADTNQRGLQVVFTSTGSATGRQDFSNKTNDFAVSDIGYQGEDPLTHTSDLPGDRSFAYLPIVAGGTAFPYQIRVGGQLVRNLRLSGQTLAKIFTNQITSWDDAAVTADNNGRALPPIPIVPVVHSEGSGSTAQFTTYLDTVYPNIWRPFAGGSGFTEYYPRKGAAVAQNGSDGVMNFISAGGSNGAIGFDEYSYALGQNYPVAKVENGAGFFTAPSQYNVAVALTQANIDTADAGNPLKYLTQDLSRVYVYNDPRTYPLSSYSYGIIPTGASDPTMSTAKRQTLVDYLYYSICDGQKEMGPIGYSPLPINLVQASIDQIGKLKAADPGVDITSRDIASCNNPTFVAGHPERNYLAEIAPQPDPCDQAGQGPCTDSKVVLVLPNTGPGGGGSSSSSAGQGPTAGSAAGSTGSSAGGAAGTAKGATARGSAAGKATAGPGGSSQAAGPGGNASGTASAAPVASRTFIADGPPATVPYRSAAASRLLGVLAAILLLIVLVAPPTLIVLLRRRPKADA